MKRSTTYSRDVLTALAALLVLTACQRDAVDDVRFSVATEGNVSVIKAGESVKFLFGGNADYITFYSGCSENNYAHVGRTEADMAKLTMECSVTQQYNDAAYLKQELLHIYLSDDFSGDYTPEALERAHWIPVSGLEYGRIPVPVPQSASAVETSGSLNVGDFVDINKPFYVAFLYKAQGRAEVPSSNGGGRYTNRPRVDVTGLNLHKLTTGGESYSLTNTTREWAFRTVMQQTATGTNYQVNDNGLLFQPQKASVDSETGREPDEVVWMVSAKINPRQVEPDRGTPIKSIEANLPSYSYTYLQAGTYTATFVATNANLWDSQQVVKQLTITVNEP